MTHAIIPAPTHDELAVPKSFRAELYWTSKRAAQIGNALEALRAELGSLTTEKIIDAARRPRSVLREFFEWRTSKAAHRYRQYQARQLMRRLHVHHPRRDGAIRAFIAVQIKGPTRRLMYLPLSAALQTEHYRREIVARFRARSKAYDATLASVIAFRRDVEHATASA